MLIRVHPSVPASVTRRRVLLGAVGGSLLLSTGACTDDPPVEPPIDPDRVALEAALELEAAALVSLQGWSASAGDRAVTQADALAVVSAHVTALGAALGTTPSASPSPSDSYELVPTLSTGQAVALLDDAASDHTRSLRTASAPISPLLASVAASDAALAAAIRRSS